MERIVFYSEGLEPEFIQHAMPHVEVRTVYSKRRLIESLVDDPALLGAIVDVEEMTPEWGSFLASAVKSFPILPMIIATTPPADHCPAGPSCMDRDGTDAVVVEALRKFQAQPKQEDRRAHQRFGWPLTGEVFGGDGTIHRITQISAGGAFLEPLGFIPGSGDTCTLDVQFQNFTMRVECRILDGRRHSDGKTSGFGVKFVNLSEGAASFLDRIVADALIKHLTDPAAEDEIPSIDLESDVLSIGDEFSLA